MRERGAVGIDGAVLLVIVVLVVLLILALTDKL